MAEQYGMDCELYVNTGTSESPTWTEISLAREAEVSQSMNTVDATTRGDSGWEYPVKGNRRMELTFEARWDATDTGLAKLDTQFNTHALAHLKVVEEDSGSGYGWSGNFWITDFGLSEPNEGVKMANFTCLLQGAPTDESAT